MLKGSFMVSNIALSNMLILTFRLSVFVLLTGLYLDYTSIISMLK